MSCAGGSCGLPGSNRVRSVTKLTTSVSIAWCATYRVRCWRSVACIALTALRGRSALWLSIAREQRKGYGSLLLAALEQAAGELKLDTIRLQARENAVPFYLRHGYQLQEKTFLLFGEIQHYLMNKQLDGVS